VALQCVSACCNVLQCVAVQYVAVHIPWRNTSGVAVCCSVAVLQCLAVFCSVLQCAVLQCVAVQCVAVQCVAVQCVAVRCVAVQCVAVHIPRRNTSRRLPEKPGVFKEFHRHFVHFVHTCKHFEESFRRRMRPSNNVAEVQILKSQLSAQCSLVIPVELTIENWLHV